MLFPVIYDDSLRNHVSQKDSNISVDGQRETRLIRQPTGARHILRLGPRTRTPMDLDTAEMDIIGEHAPTPSIVSPRDFENQAYNPENTLSLVPPSASRMTGGNMEQHTRKCSENPSNVLVPTSYHPMSASQASQDLKNYASKKPRDTGYKAPPDQLSILLCQVGTRFGTRTILFTLSDITKYVLEHKDSYRHVIVMGKLYSEPVSIWHILNQLGGRTIFMLTNEGYNEWLRAISRLHRERYSNYVGLNDPVQPLIVYPPEDEIK